MALILGVAVSAADGQRPASWAALSVPSGVQAGSIRQIGKLVIYEHNKKLHVYSAFTRSWHLTSYPSGSQLRYANDWLLIQTGQNFTAFSSMHGVFQRIYLSSRAYVVNPAAQRNDSMVLVQDGDQLHSFSGFTGQWLQQSVDGNAVVAVQRHVAVVAEDDEVMGLSAFGSRWVKASTSGPMTTVLADGTVGIAQNNTEIWGFSAQRQNWTTTRALAGSPTPTYRGDVAVWMDSQTLLGFSGLQGAFASMTSTGMPTIVVDQQLAVASLGAGTALFSAPLAAWKVWFTASTPTVATSSATAILVESSFVHAYSALLGTVSTKLVSSSQHDVNWTVASVVSRWTDIPYLYSAYTGQWRAGPVSPRRTAPMTAINSALLETKVGYSAFSARTGAFVPCLVATTSTTSASSATSTPHVDRNSGILAVQEKREVHVFDARRDVWVSQSLPNAGAVSLAIWRTSMLFRQGRRCWGYGSQVGEIDSTMLPESAVASKVSSESVSVSTARHLVAYSPVPDLLPLAQFPEFRRMFADGTVMELQLRGEPGAAAAVLLGFRMATPVTLPYGAFYLFPGSMGALWGGTVPTDGTQVLRIPMPGGLRGLDVSFQAGLIPAAGVYLSRMSTVCVH